MDGFYMGITSNASFMIPNVTPGVHTFEAGHNVPGSTYDSTTVYIDAGPNYVTLEPLMEITII